MIVVSFGGLFLNLLGLTLFHQDDDEDHGGSQNIHALFLHVLADTLGSVGAIVSAFLIRNFNMIEADSFCALIVSIMIIVSVIPTISVSCSKLLID